MKRIKRFLVIPALIIAFSGCGNSGKDPGVYYNSEGTNEKKKIYENNSENAGKEELSIPEEPPKLFVSGGGLKTEALRGTYTWEYYTDKGEFKGVASDSPHPLDSRDHIPAVKLSQKENPEENGFITMGWEIPPDYITVTAWEVDWENFQNAESDEVFLEGATFYMKNGEYVYEIKAEWLSAETFRGTAYYSFYGVFE